MLKIGLIVALMGMGTVFSFLLILVFAMIITAYVLRQIGKVFPEKSTETSSAKPSSSSDEEIAVAIAATQALI
jgi:sodium pump decarboxylase gamma subunit